MTMHKVPDVVHSSDLSMYELSERVFSTFKRDRMLTHTKINRAIAASNNHLCSDSKAASSHEHQTIIVAAHHDYQSFTCCHGCRNICSALHDD
jgi:hypothetical protein